MIFEIDVKPLKKRTSERGFLLNWIEALCCQTQPAVRLGGAAGDRGELRVHGAVGERPEGWQDGRVHVHGDLHGGGDREGARAWRDPRGPHAARDPWNWLDVIVLSSACVSCLYTTYPLLFCPPATPRLSRLISCWVLTTDLLVWSQVCDDDGVISGQHDEPANTTRPARIKSVTALPGLRIICTALIEAVQRLRDVRSSDPLLHSLTAFDPHYCTALPSRCSQAMILTLFVLSIFSLIGAPAWLEFSSVVWVMSEVPSEGQSGYRACLCLLSIGLQLYRGSLHKKCILKPPTTLPMEEFKETPEWINQRMEWITNKSVS